MCNISNGCFYFYTWTKYAHAHSAALSQKSEPQRHSTFLQNGSWQFSEKCINKLAHLRFKAIIFNPLFRLGHHHHIDIIRKKEVYLSNFLKNMAFKPNLNVIICQCSVLARSLFVQNVTERVYMKLRVLLSLIVVVIHHNACRRRRRMHIWYFCVNFFHVICFFARMATRATCHWNTLVFYFLFIYFIVCNCRKIVSRYKAVKLLLHDTSLWKCYIVHTTPHLWRRAVDTYTAANALLWNYFNTLKDRYLLFTMYIVHFP